MEDGKVNPVVYWKQKISTVVDIENLPMILEVYWKQKISTVVDFHGS